MPIQLTPFNCTRRIAAFSLVELVLVLGIIAVVSAMAIPRYSNALHGYRATSAAKRLAADLQMAQFNARSLGATRTLTISVSNNSYQIAGEKDLIKASNSYSVQLSDLPYRTKINSAQFGAASSTTPSITFNTFGMPNNGGSITLTSGKSTKTIVVAPYTGAITIQ